MVLAKPDGERARLGWQRACRAAVKRAAELPASGFEGSLRHLLETSIFEGVPNEEHACEILWLSSRTLRRRLAEESTTWRRVVQDHLYASAVTRLQDGTRSIREISQELGYSHQAHFTRFFRCRAGMTPSEYRQEIAQVGGLR